MFYGADILDTSGLTASLVTGVHTLSRMNYTCVCWLMYLFCLHGLTTEHIIPAKDGKTTHASEISKSDTSKGEVTFKQQLPTTNRHLGNSLNDIDVLIKQLTSVINQIQGLNQGQSPSEQKEGCVTNKKGQLKCKSHNKGTMGSLEHFQSLHELFSKVSTLFSSVQNKVLEDMVRLIMQSVVENTKSMTQHLEESILILTETVHTRLTNLEESVLRIMPPDTPPQLTEDNPSYLDPQIIPESPNVEQYPMQEPSRGNNTERLLSNVTITGYSINMNFTDFIKCYWLCCLLPHEDVKYPAIMSPDVDETRNKGTGELTEHYWNETSSLIRKFQLGHGIDLPGSVSGVLTTILLVLAGGVAAVVLLWSCHRAWKAESDYTPSLINKNAGIYTTSGLTVITISTYTSTHSQVITIIERLTHSHEKLQTISKTTKFIKINKMSAMKDDFLDMHGDSEKLLVFIDVSRDKKETLLEVEDGLHEQMKVLSLEDICAALGDTVIIIYGDSASRQLPLGAIYNTTVVERLPVPALRALCRIGRFLTVNTAFTNTQTVLLQHWLQTPVEAPCEEDI